MTARQTARVGGREAGFSQPLCESAAPTAAEAPGVLHVVLSLAPGGTERLVIEIVRRLAGDFRMAVCCLDVAGDWAADVTSRGVPVIALGRTPGFHPSIGLRLARLARTMRVDVLHCHQYSPYVYGAIAALVSRDLGLVCTEHGRLSDAPPSTRRRVANAIISRLPGRIYAVSAELRRHLIDAGFAARGVATIHNGIEPGRRPGAAERRAARRQLGITDSTFVIGTVARLDPAKDLSVVLGAFADVRVALPDTRLVVIGDGPERARLEAQASEGGVRDAVCFTGHRDDARSLLPAFDVYVNSSRTEGMSLTILEAMAAMLPVVATSVGGTPEIVVEGRTGALVPAGDPGALAGAITRLSDDRARRRRMGEAGRARVEGSFTITRMVERYARVYDEVRGR